MRLMFLAVLLVTSLFLSLSVPADAAAPSGSFVAATTSGEAPLTVQFVDSSTGSPSSWAWSFGDGNTSSEKNPVHTYSSAGTFTVTLTVTNDDGSDTVSKTGYITVSKTTGAPAASFVAATTSGESPLTVQFVDASTGTPTSWVWSFGDGGTSTVQNPSHTYSSTGTYTVTLTASNAGGSDTISRSGYIAVTDTVSSPVASFISAETSGSVPFTVQFADSSANSPTSWVWSFGDGGTSAEQNPSHTYTADGSYTVTLTATNAAGSDTVSEPGYITATAIEPVASFTANITSGSVPLVVQFTDTSEYYPTEWSWRFGDGDTSDEQNPVHIYDAAGSYTVRLTAENGAGSDTVSESGYVTVSDTSTPVPSFTADVRTGSAPLTVRFTDTSGNDPSSWLWAFGDGGSSTEQNPAHTYTYAGTFTVSLTAYNDAGSRTSTAREYITTSSRVVTTPVTLVQQNVPPVTPERTTPAMATQPPVSPPAATPASAQAGSGSVNLLIPGIILAAIVVIAAVALLKWGRGRYERRNL